MAARSLMIVAAAVTPALSMSSIEERFERLEARVKAYEDGFNRNMIKIFPFMKDFETLQLTFDGNTVLAKGMGGSVDKLKKRLKILELI